MNDSAGTTILSRSPVEALRRQEDLFQSPDLIATGLERGVCTWRST